MVSFFSGDNDSETGVWIFGIYHPPLLSNCFAFYR